MSFGGGFGATDYGGGFGGGTTSGYNHFKDDSIMESQSLGGGAQRTSIGSAKSQDTTMTMTVGDVCRALERDFDQEVDVKGYNGQPIKFLYLCGFPRNVSDDNGLLKFSLQDTSGIIDVQWHYAVGSSSTYSKRNRVELLEHIMGYGAVTVYGSLWTVGVSKAHVSASLVEACSPFRVKVHTMQALEEISLMKKAGANAPMNSSSNRVARDITGTGDQFNTMASAFDGAEVW